MPTRISFSTRRLRLGAALAAVAFAGTAGVLHAQAQPPRGGPHAKDGGMMMFGGPGGPTSHRIDRMLDGLNATPDQRTRIRQIVAAAESDIQAQRDAGKSLRDRGLRIFTAPTVDAAAAESLRQEMTAQDDQASRRKLDAMLEIAKVLTPEQRAKIGARLQERQVVLQERRQRMEQEHRSHPMAPAPPKP